MRSKTLQSMQDVNSVNAVKFKNCIRFSSDENILKVFSSLDPGSRKHILMSYFSSFKPNLYKYDESSQDKTIFDRFGQILEHQRMLQNTIIKTEDEPSQICTLSSELFANIISFVNMKDRLLICERISTTLYDICQRPEAQSELIITKSFVKNALYDQIDLRKFHHITRLCIDFVFCNPSYNYYRRNRHPFDGDLQLKYYTVLNEIVSNSVSTLKTIEYNLSANSFRSFLGDMHQWNRQYDGSFLDFLSNLGKIHNKSSNLFHNVQTVIWMEKERTIIRGLPGGGKNITDRKHDWLTHTDDGLQFVKYFKNIKSLRIPNHFNLSSYPLVSQIWCNPHYLQHLQHLHVNLKDIVLDEEDEQDDDHVVTEIGHPLVMLPKFEQLQSLHLVLPVCEESTDYYHALLETLSHDGFRCGLVTDVAIEFEIDSYVKNARTLRVMDTVWDYIVAHCPNIRHFKCVVNNHSSVRLKKAKHRYISRLNETCIESIYYESEALDIVRNMLPWLGRLNACNLKQLTLHFNAYDSVDDGNRDLGEGLKVLQLDKFECLQSFECIYGNECTFKKGQFIGHVMKHVIGFLQYIDSQAALSPTLSYVLLEHKAYRKNARKKGYGYGSFFKCYVDHLSIHQEESLQITKLLTRITTKHEQIKTLELLPIGIRHDELQFLDFWYNGADKKQRHLNSELNVIPWHKIKKSYFVDLKLHHK
eukprot:64009_1